ncbi:hypothetical protein A2335_00200 [Candidatus Peregrinibacteria bacterium RIFOXYB2_FULL_32_7]|nr:MAG: hypothetical protein A2335_00200 [Candidatus Peregrinibacteria bacterium RIFOXYB2_FULL_32_7]
MKNAKKILSGVVLGTLFAGSVAFAATSLPQIQKGPLYQLANKIAEHRLDMDLEEMREHVKNRDLKEALEANGFDYEKAQSTFRTRVKNFLDANDISAQIQNTENGVAYQFTTDNENLLKRIKIFEARVEYFNDVHSDLEFNLDVEKVDNTIYFHINGETERATKRIQELIPETPEA